MNQKGHDGKTPLSLIVELKEQCYVVIYRILPKTRIEWLKSLALSSSSEGGGTGRLDIAEKEINNIGTELFPFSNEKYKQFLEFLKNEITPKSKQAVQRELEKLEPEKH